MLRGTSINLGLVLRSFTRMLAIVGTCGMLAPGSLVPLSAQDETRSEARAKRPNILLILADDLGSAELGCYGQQQIRTPNLDALAAQGMRFTQAYSGSPVCAPARCVLLSGRHAGHAFIRNNSEGGGWGPDAPEGQLPIPSSEITLGERLQALGYETGFVGKWGLGGPGSTGHPLYQGFDRFYGYLCQRVAHNHYPTHLWDNHDVDILGNDYFAAHQKIEAPLSDSAEYERRFMGRTYAPDRMLEEALKFLDQQREEPFFLEFATTIPHLALQVPSDSLAEYDGVFEESEYLGDRSYLPHPRPRSAYAAMITRMDRDLGRLFAKLDELGIANETLVIFTSDNGPTFTGGADTQYFQSAGELRGLKGSVYEGGLRVPLIVRWPGRVPAGTTSSVPTSFQDVVPTLMEASGGSVPSETDGVSMLPVWTGSAAAADRTVPLYWELGKAQALRVGDWKLVRSVDAQNRTKAELFDLASDPGEQHNRWEDSPEQAELMLQAIRAARTTSAEFPSPFDDGQ